MPPDDMLRVDRSELDGAALVKVEGEIDAHSVALLDSALADVTASKEVVIDMAGVRFMDSQGLHALIALSLRMDGMTGSVRIQNPSRSVQRLLELTGLVDQFDGNFSLRAAPVITDCSQ